MTRRVAALTIAGVIGAGVLAGGVAFAAADPSATSSANPKAGTQHAKAGKHTGRLGRGLHGEFTVRKKDGGFATLDAQRGQVTAVDGASLTVRSADGFTHRYTVTKDTKIRKDGARSDLSAVKVGDAVGVLATHGGTDQATLVRDGRKAK